MTVPRALLAVLLVWLLGAAFLPVGGFVHFLLIVALILALIHWIGRGH